MAQLTIQQAFDLALQHHQAGRPNEAEQLYRQVLAQQPTHAGAVQFLGVIAHQAGKNDIAVELIRRAIRLNPNWPDAHNNLGAALEDLGQLDDAIAAYRQAIALLPNYAEAHANLGGALRGKGELDEAIAACRKAIALNPNLPQAHDDLGNALADKGELDQAIVAYRQAIVLKPNSGGTYNNLGNALEKKGELDEAIAALQHAIALCPDLPEAYYNLGNALTGKRQFDGGVAAYRKAIALKSNYANAHMNLGNVLKNKGLLDEAIAAYRHAIALNPSYAEAHSNLLLTLHYHPGWDAAAIAHEHRLWNRQHAEPLAQYIRPHTNNRDSDRRLRIGYVSPDLREHAVARFLLPLLANHDHQCVEVFAYAQVRLPDATTQRLRCYSDAWRSLIGLSDAQAADQIRQDQIDILVDLAGHTADHRLLVLAHKPAPVQVTCLGYPDTTGLSTMDYRLTDAYADPPGQTEPCHSEQLIRLSPSAWCFEATAGVPLPQRHQGPITFGCFNTFAKVTQPMLKLWSEILRAVPESRLLLKSAGLGSASLRQEVEQRLAEFGIAARRLELRGQEPDYTAHLALYGRMDVALDTFPYHGTTTTCEAMWMGVPVISLAGSTHVSRVGVSLLTNVGLPELVANSAAGYLRLAVNLASDLPRLNQLHSTLRQRMQQSPLMDGPSFARNVEGAYRHMWRTWCQMPPFCNQQPAADISR